MKESPIIDIEIYYSVDEPWKMGFNLWRRDHHKLTSQHIIDAIAEVLMERFDYVPELESDQSRKLQ